MAASGNNLRGLKILLDFQADRSGANMYYETPLMLARICKYQEAAKLLEEYHPSEQEMLSSRLECKL